MFNGSIEVDLGSGRHDTGRIDRLVRTIVVLLDVLHIHSALNVRHLVEVTSEAPEVGVINQSLLVCLEVAYSITTR